MLALKSIISLLPLFIAGLANAAPAPVPSGGVGARMNDTPPVYEVVSDCEFWQDHRWSRSAHAQSTTSRSSWG